jgi:CRISPR system Cascade subunit CasC
VDDIKDQADEQGSGHLNSALFSAGTFYRYASVNVADLLSNLRSDPSVDRPEAIATDLIRDFLSAFITAMPEGKRTATAPFTVPDLVYISVRADRPVSLANAFEQPVRAAGGGYAAPARPALNDYAEKIYRLLGRRGIVHHAHTSVDDKPLEALGEAVDSYDDVVSQAVARITAK